jgi:uncharacterized protein YbjT (DUF2867 family)
VKIVVIGGTGLIGSKVVANLTEQGHEAVPASPRLGINTITGEGLAEALVGASVVVDVSNSPKPFAYESGHAFFDPSTRNLEAAEEAAGVGHHAALSIVGTDRLADGGGGYSRAKLEQEELIRASPIPYTIVHATQFFEFVQDIVDGFTEGNVVRLPAASFQPMAADDVAAALARVAVGSPANGIVEIAGPEPFRFEELARRVLKATNDPREVVADPEMRYFESVITERTLLPADGASLGETRFDDWLRQSATTKAGVA